MYELSHFADYWIVVVVGTLKQCQDYARKFQEWNESSSFLIEDMENHERYYFTDDLELVSTYEYQKHIAEKG